MYDKIEMHTLGSLSAARVEVPVLAYKIPRWAIGLGLFLLGFVSYQFWLNRKKNKTIKEKSSVIEEKSKTIYSQNLLLLANMPSEPK